MTNPHEYEVNSNRLHHSNFILDKKWFYRGFQKNIKF
jgi:hypothetical protein